MFIPIHGEASNDKYPGVARCPMDGLGKDTYSRWFTSLVLACYLDSFRDVTCSSRKTHGSFESGTLGSPPVLFSRPPGDRHTAGGLARLTLRP